MSPPDTARWNLFDLGRWTRKLRYDLARIRSFEDVQAGSPAQLSALELMTIVLEDRRFFHHPHEFKRQLDFHVRPPFRDWPRVGLGPVYSKFQGASMDPLQSL